MFEVRSHLQQQRQPVGGNGEAGPGFKSVSFAGLKRRCSLNRITVSTVGCVCLCVCVRVCVCVCVGSSQQHQQTGEKPHMFCLWSRRKSVRKTFSHSGWRSVDVYFRFVGVQPRWPMWDMMDLRFVIDPQWASRSFKCSAIIRRTPQRLFKSAADSRLRLGLHVDG